MDKEKRDNMTTGIRVVDVPFKKVNDGEKRFDASFYTQDVIAARVLLDKIQRKGIKIDKVSNLSNNIFWPGRFKRRYVSSKKGTPFLMPSEAFMFLPEPTKYIIGYPGDVSVKDGWLLISRSGTIGRCLITTKTMLNFVLSDDLIRIIPKNEKNIYYLYAYLNTWIGQTFLIKDQYGATVKHIEPHHVADIPIPRISDLEEEINQKILKAHKLREEAQELLLKAEEMIYSKLGLPKINEDDIEYFGGKIGRVVKAFEIKASELDYRLDASYHEPILNLIKKTLNSARHRIIKLGRTINDMFIPTRFKRPYVKNSEDGIPFLQGAHITMIKPMEVKFLWKGMTNIQKTLLKKNWVLMTRSGTVGRIGFVSDSLDGWAASEHILRIIVKPEINPGYIVAFLSSPYGDYQIKGKIYGAVVDEIAEQDTSLIEDIEIVLPDENVQYKIGSLVIDAYNKKDKASQIEEEAIKQLEITLTEIAKGVK